MTVTPDSPWRCPPRISLAGFERILVGGNPGVLAERPASSYYNLCVNKGVDPLYVLAKFSHESSLGTAGVAVTTHSWGNTRTPNFGAVPVGSVPGASGSFPVWRDWLDGLKSTVERLVTPEWIYHNRQSIREIYDWPPDQKLVWAPAGDFNNPASYLRAVIDFMNAHEENMMAGAQIPGFVWHPADTAHYAPGRTQKIVGGAQHYSAGTNSLGHLTVSSQPPVSATLLVAKNPTLEKRGYQLVRIEDTAWTTGAIVNPKTVSIEKEHQEGDELDDMDYRVLAQTWADVTRYLEERPHLGAISVIRGHNEWVGDGRVCPDGINVARITREWQVLMGTVPTPAGDPRVVEKATPDPWADSNPWGKKWWIDDRFLAKAQADFMRYGYVTSEAFLMDDKLVQFFERARMEIDAAGNYSEGLTGFESMVARYPERRRAV